MPGWLVRVVTKRMGSDKQAVPMVETYIVHEPDRLKAWAKVAALVIRTDPLATAEVVKEATEQQIAAQKVRDGRVKLYLQTT